MSERVNVQVEVQDADLLAHLRAPVRTPAHAPVDFDFRNSRTYTCTCSSHTFATRTRFKNFQFTTCPI